MNSAECSFTIHHWPALQEWDVTALEFPGRTECFTAGDPGAPGLLAALGHCVRLAAGKPAAIVIEAADQRYELRLAAEEGCGNPPPSRNVIAASFGG